MILKLNILKVHLEAETTFYELSLLYLFLGSIVCSIFIQSEIIKAVISLPSFFIIPLLFGKVIDDMARLIKRRVKNEITISFSHLIYQFLLGTFLTLILVFSLQMAYLYYVVRNLHFIILAIIALDLMLMRYKYKMFPHFSQNMINHTFSLALLVLFSIIPFITKLSFVDPPLPAWGGWNLPSITVQPALRMINSGVVESLARSVGFLYIGPSCFIFNVDPSYFVYSGTLILTVIYSIGIYFLTYKFSNNIFLSLMSGIFGIFINISPYFHNMIIYVFKYNQIITSLNPWIILMITENIEKKRCSLKKTIIFIIIISIITFSLFMLDSINFSKFIVTSLSISNKFFDSFLKNLLLLSFPLLSLLIDFKLKDLPISASLLALIFTILLYTVPPIALIHISSFLFLIFFDQIIKRKKGKVIVGMFSSILFFFIILVWTDIWKYSISISNIYTPSSIKYSTILWVKRTNFIEGNSNILIFLSIIGSFFMFFSKNRYNLLSLSMFSYTSFLYFFPDYNMRRALNLMTPFMAIAISQIVFILYKKIIDKFSYYFRSHLHKKYTLIHMIVLFILVIIVMSSIPDPLYTKFSRCETLSKTGSNMTRYEYEAAVWLRENTNETEVIISDYWTMMLLNQISNKIWTIGPCMEAQYLPEENKDFLFYLKHNLFNAQDGKQAYQAIRYLPLMLDVNMHWTEKYYMDRRRLYISDLTFLIVLSPRTVAWMEKSDQDELVHDQRFPIFSSINLENLDIFDNDRFKLIYEIPSKLYIFRVIGKA